MQGETLSQKSNKKEKKEGDGGVGARMHSGPLSSMQMLLTGQCDLSYTDWLPPLNARTPSCHRLLMSATGCGCICSWYILRVTVKGEYT